MNQIQENHCQKLFDGYQKLVKFVKQVCDKCTDHNGDYSDCMGCQAFRLLIEIGEV